jgi:hypothetical protein
MIFYQFTINKLSLRKYFEMRFYARFAYYMGGFIIGLFFLMLILNGKDTRCSYFPNERVLKDIRKKPLYYSNEALGVLQDKCVDTSDVRNTFTYGDVDFDKSNIKTKGGKLYLVNGKTSKNQNIVIHVINYETKALVQEIKKQ